MAKKRKLYKTSQIELKEGEQLRITFKRRTIFVLANGRGLRVNPGGYARRAAT